MPHRRPPPAWRALPFALALTACVQPAPTPAALSLAPSLLTCRDEPMVPDMQNDADFMGYVIDVIEAGEDCRGRLARVREVAGPVDRR